MRRRSILFLLWLAPCFAAGQHSYTRMNELFRYVDQADSLSEKFNRTFYLEKFENNNENYRESWRYAENHGRIFYFQIDYLLDSTTFTEVYYLNREHLVCSEEYEKVNYAYAEDELRYGGIYYFESAVPRQIVILGKKQQHSDVLRPESLVLNRFEKRYAELKRHIPMLAR